MKHLIRIFLFFIMSHSLIYGNIDLNASTEWNSICCFNTRYSIDIGVPSLISKHEFSSDIIGVPYCILPNIYQDTSKINSGKVLFGRSHLKKHFELHGSKTIVNEKKRNKWINKAVKKLRKTKNSNDFQELVINELIHEEYYKASYRLISKGIIKFEDGSYLKLMSTSNHTNKEIGDITLAVNEEGDVYINQGHICGSIIHFETHERNLPKTALGFLLNFKSDTDDEPWLSYTIDN